MVLTKRGGLERYHTGIRDYILQVDYDAIVMH